MSTDERPPPIHTRALRVLRDVFFPAAFRDQLRELRDLWRESEREAHQELMATDDDYRRTREQGRIVAEGREPGESFPEFFIRLWNAGKAENTPPPPPPRTFE